MSIFDGIRSFFRPNITYVYGGDYGVSVANLDAAQLYKTQPNLRAVISFLADNAAQIPIKVYERASDTDRPRVHNSPAALLMSKPGLCIAISMSSVSVTYPRSKTHTLWNSLMKP